MKKLFLIIPVLCLLVYSCSSSIELDELSSKNLKISDFEYVGELHNQGLANSYSEIKGLVNSGHKISKENKQKLLQVQKEITMNFVSEQDFEQDIIVVTKQQIEIGADDFVMFNQSVSRTSQSNIIPDSLLLGISDEAQDMIFRIFEIMEDEDLDTASLNSRIHSIEQEAISSLEIDEQFVVLSTSSVAKHTLVYWNENHEDWLNLLDGDANGRTADSDINWKAAGKADVGGAALAGLSLAVSGTGAAMAATGPAGWAGIGLVVVGRGLQASAVRMLWDLW